MEVPVGEECKDLSIASQLWQTLLESNADRDTVIINIGGGCVSDLGGFVAAGYKRGIRYVNVPTTLVGMVDAAIGGKTALNLEGSKNQIGFFHQPEIVCIEPEFLSTLPDEEYFNGVCEMLKTFMIGDREAYESLCNMVLDGNLEVTPATLVVTVKSPDPVEYDGSVLVENEKGMFSCSVKEIKSGHMALGKASDSGHEGVLAVRYREQFTIDLSNWFSVDQRCIIKTDTLTFIGANIEHVMPNGNIYISLEDKEEVIHYSEIRDIKDFYDNTHYLFMRKKIRLKAPVIVENHFSTRIKDCS